MTNERERERAEKVGGKKERKRKLKLFVPKQIGPAHSPHL